MLLLLKFGNVTKLYSQQFKQISGLVKIKQFAMENILLSAIDEQYLGTEKFP